MRNLCLSFVAVAFLANPLYAQSTSTAQPAHPLTAEDRQALAEFDQRLKQYVTMRNGVNRGDSKQRETKDPSKISDARASLAAKIREKRATAKPGDILSPHIQQHFRKFLAPEMIGVKGQNTKGSIKDEGPAPGAVKMAINADYPKDQPLGTMPPNVLKALPQLPDGIEFRFVDRYLVLRDAESNLIIDFMPAAIPAK
jgi:hypothetical protein